MDVLQSMDRDSLIQVDMIVSTLSTLAMFSSPWTRISQVRRDANTGDTNAVPFVVLALNCMNWIVYGNMAEDMMLFYINMFGLVLGSYYTYTCVKFLKDDLKKMFLLRQINGAIFFFIFSMFYISLVRQDERQLHFGIICSFVCIFVFAAPLTTLSTVISTKSTSTLTFPLSLCGAICSMSWVIYGFFVNDPFVYGPNSIGLFLSLIQLSLFALYPSTPSLKKHTKSLDV